MKTSNCNIIHSLDATGTKSPPTPDTLSFLARDSICAIALYAIARPSHGWISQNG